MCLLKEETLFWGGGRGVSPLPLPASLCKQAQENVPANQGAHMQWYVQGKPQEETI